MLSKAALWIFGLLSLYTLHRQEPYRQNRVLTWDKAGYYIYLPAVFIYHDLDGLAFSPDIARKYHPQGDLEWYYLYPYPGGKRLNKYAVGSSLFEAPAFLIAHNVCRLRASCTADGYSPPYQLAVALAALFWVLAGLVALRAFLRHYFPDPAVAVALLVTGLGTNLFYYTACEPGMSHTYVFFCCASLLWLTVRFLRTGNTILLLGLGLLTGLCTIVRPTSLVFASIPLLWEVRSLKGFRERLRLMVRHPLGILLAVLAAGTVISLQLAYWHHITGHWVHFSYEGEGFNFLRPRLQDGLFSYRKGWFVYTPLALLCIPGAVLLWLRQRELFWGSLFPLAATVYIVFSWRMWYYGGGFGARPMIDAYPLLAVPVAACAFWVLKSRHRGVRMASGVALAMAILLNLFQSWQYGQSIIHWDRMNRAYYWQVFLKTATTPEDRALMMTDNEFEAADRDDAR